MTYRVLARKYRPQTFEEIVGQSHVATTLINALRGQKVAHAYLFSGPRGVGKTTTARILAKALNCEKGPTPTPCNQCESCRRITNSQELIDVMEIDAASNRGIEEIRALREQVLYAPAHSRYKVYIVDEAHQITHDAFNAFLKTLEEPPEHAVFILATTEHQKIPPTILSRCQIFRFRRVSIEDITAQLERILAQEKVSVEAPALDRVARAAGGSLRDALSLLDQALAYASDGLSVKQVETLLGFLPDDFLQSFAAALIARDPAAILQWIKRLAEEGWEPTQFVRDFREYLRQVMVDQLASGAKAEALRLAGQSLPLAQFLQMLKGMGQCLEEMRWNDNPRVVLELYSLRLAQPFVDAGELLRRIEELEKGHGSPGASVSRPEGVIAATEDASTRASSKGDSSLPLSGGETRHTAGEASPNVWRGSRPTDGSAEGEGEEKVTSTDRLPLTPTLSPKGRGGFMDLPRVPPDTYTQWKLLVAELWKKPMLAAQMEKAVLRSATGTEWVIAFGDKFGLELAQRSKALIEESAAKVLGHRVAIQAIHQPGLAVESADEMVVSPSPQERHDERQSAIVKDPSVQKVLHAFNGRVRTESGEQ